MPVGPDEEYMDYFTRDMPHEQCPVPPRPGEEKLDERYAAPWRSKPLGRVWFVLLGTCVFTITQA